MQYTHTKPDRTQEQVTKEKWSWVAIYQDGTQLQQFDDKGIFHTVSEIEQNKLRQFVMVHDELPPLFIEFNPNLMKLIHFYRRSRLNVGTNQETMLTAYIVGYSQRLEGREIYSLVMITPEDKFVLTDNREITAW